MFQTSSFLLLTLAKLEFFFSIKWFFFYVYERRNSGKRINRRKLFS
ncbi:hypothetical protein CHCC5022_2784 [Bacillus paralicheniformis]|uniref:Uncharacterized protein n=1 Tax=Bacillus paralicheniformis TaxID=1648923 RepID=A0A7Z0X0W1_9BACI|nr:hypothetical protein B4121_0655 [Bacillus paralicheniformis]TWJ58962.1 hypothetical protein CHCC5022_2784 [Bacillus paralicheniformis]TWJ73949.1 hypothetical protein CHCC4186_2096 [Bacillus paralicheniformis]TWK33459.1 hypothetical protein CHCC20372_0491 [Bacillus paralicheniformis]TWK47665.1 hypothetical protein CHCC20347_2094 [Bacillus paralicheniformis]